MLFELSTNAWRTARHRNHRFFLTGNPGLRPVLPLAKLESGAYRGSAYGKSLTVSMDEKGLLLRAAEEDFQALWRSYLTLILIITKSEELWQTRIRF